LQDWGILMDMKRAASPALAAPLGAGGGSLASAIYFLALLALVGVSQQGDKILFSMALEPIRTEFKLSDSQLGLINGPAFALFFGAAAVPIARLAEIKGRSRIIAASVAAWTLFTTLTALASGFAALFAARVFVGIGEAGCGPATQSLVAARFPPERRSGALSVILAGGFVGMTLGLAVGGLIVQKFGWRDAFLLVGAPGFLLAPLVWLTLREPPGLTAKQGGSSLVDLLPIIRKPAFLHLFAMLAVISVAGYGMLAWAPAFFMRDYDMKAAEVGAWLGLVLGGGTIVGVLLGGAVGDRLNHARRGAGLWFVFWSLVASTPVGIGIFVVHDRYVSLALLLASTVIGTMVVAPTYAALHDLVPAPLRATAFAVCSLAVMVAGQGLGPLVVGIFSDLARLVDGRNSLRVALTAINIFGVWALPHSYFLVRAYRRDGVAIA
jgi:predicted MFS family arabinose efflux permease